MAQKVNSGLTDGCINPRVAVSPQYNDEAIEIFELKEL
jgi:hypothetical protein